MNCKHILFLSFRQEIQHNLLGHSVQMLAISLFIVYWRCEGQPRTKNKIISIVCSPWTKTSDKLWLFKLGKIKVLTVLKRAPPGRKCSIIHWRLLEYTCRNIFESGFVHYFFKSKWNYSVKNRKWLILYMFICRFSSSFYYYLWQLVNDEHGLIWINTVSSNYDTK